MSTSEPVALITGVPVAGEFRNRGGGGEFTTDAYLTPGQRDGSEDAGADLSALLASVGGDGQVTLAPGIYRVDADLALDRPVRFAPGATLRPAATATIRVSRRLQEDRVQIWDLSLGGSVLYQGEARESILPEHFGARGDGRLADNTLNPAKTDDSAAFAAMVAAIPDSGGTVRLGVRTYFLGTGAVGVLVPAGKHNVRIEGHGWGDMANVIANRAGTELWYLGQGNALQVGEHPTTIDPATQQLVAATPTNTFSAERFRVNLWDGVSGTWKGRTGTAIRLIATRFHRFDSVQVTTVQKGQYAASEPGTGETGIVIEGSNDFSAWGTFIHCYVRGDFRYGLDIDGGVGGDEAAGTGAGNTTWVSCSFHNMAQGDSGLPGTTGVLLRKGGGNVFVNCDHDGWEYAVDVYIATGNSWFGCRWEGGGNTVELRLNPPSQKNVLIGGGSSPGYVQDLTGALNWIVPQGRVGLTPGGSLVRGSTLPIGAFDWRGAGIQTGRFGATDASIARWIVSNSLRSWSNRVGADGLLAIYDETAGRTSVTFDQNRSTRLAGRLRYALPTTFADGDQTPSVLDGNVFKTANTAATTITTFDAGPTAADLMDGQEITVLLDANTTIRHDGVNIHTRSGANIAGAAHKVVKLVRINGIWYEA